MERISTREQFKTWASVAAQSFGGPAGQIAVIHQTVVEEKKWISEERFLHALNFCMFLPGPEAQQLVTYIGWIVNRWRGGLIAGTLFVLPGFLSIMALSFLYVIFNDVPFVQGLFYGMKPAIIAIVTSSLLKISKRSLTSSFYWMIAISAFALLFFFHVSFPVVVLLSSMTGIIYGKFQPKITTQETLPLMNFPLLSQTLMTLALWIFLWVTPIVVVTFIFGTSSTFNLINIFFSKVAMVSFGGSYAALSYVAQRAVEDFLWVTGPEMIDGLAMAETTPGPLIKTLQFVGFMGAYRFPDLASPYWSGFVGSLLTTWMIFTPCFLWIFTFAPYVEFIRGKKVFSDALKAITASVVGVIFNLSLWFVLKSLFKESYHFEKYFLKLEVPIHSSVDPMGVGICLLAMLLQFKFKRGLFEILGSCMVIRIIYKLA